MIGLAQVSVPREQLAAFCRRHHIRRLALFGSILRDDFRPESDVDVLVEFEPEQVPGLLRFAGMEQELSDLFGRRVDLNTPNCFGPELRQRILAEAQVQYG